MAQPVRLRNPQTGLLKTGYIGFSWTTFFFGIFPPLFRGDFKAFIGTFVVVCILAVVSYGIAPWPAMIVWAFMYNRYYTRKLVETGYVLAGREDLNHLAAQKLGIAEPMALAP